MNLKVLIMSFFGLFIVSCSNRSSKVFSAFDELHYIILYEQRDEFELLYNGVNTATGIYSLSNDTIQLTYTKKQFKEFDPNETLTRKILIDMKSKTVKSIDDKMQFCANISIDNRKKK